MSVRGGDSDLNLLSDREYSVVVPHALSGVTHRDSNNYDIAMNVPTSFDYRGQED